LSRPVVALPSRAIEDVTKVRINKKPFFGKNKNKDEKEEVMFKYMFEVHLRQDYEDVF